MNSPHGRPRGETAPTWLETVPGLERTVDILLKLFVLTAPVGYGLVGGLDLLAVFTKESSGAVNDAFAGLMGDLYAITFLVWVLAVAVWVGSHIFRPHAPIRFGDMAFLLMAPSCVLYLFALA